MKTQKEQMTAFEDQIRDMRDSLQSLYFAKTKEIQERAFKTTQEQAEFAVAMGVIAQAQVKAGQLQTLINSIKHDES